MSYPPTQTLTPEEKDLVWKFRFYLTRDKRVMYTGINQSPPPIHSYNVLGLD
jgi:hypothetical protein